MANTENIEAKLAAYVEGELDADDRADIEKHLASNPQHHALLEELAKMRFVVRDLPRESAPPEILDRVQQQIERSLLLDDATQDVGTLKLNRWPSMLIAASIAFLAVGLGVVVYLSLPEKSRPNVIVMKTEGRAAMPGDTSASPAAAADKEVAKNPSLKGGMDSATELADSEKRGKLEIAEEKPVDDIAKVGKSGKGGGDMAAAAPTVPAPTPSKSDHLAKDAETGFASKPGGGSGLANENKKLADPFENNETMYVFVNSSNPSQTQSELNNYLIGNQFKWQVDAEPMPEAVNLEQQKEVAASRMRQESVQLKQSIGQAVQPPTQAGQTQQQQVAMGDNAQVRRYVVRGVTRAQVSELNSVISRNGGQQQSQFTVNNRADNDLSRANNASPRPAATDEQLRTELSNQSATTQPSVQPGESLQVTVDQLVGPGVEKTNTVRVTEDGLITLPMVEPIRVSGLDESQVKSKISDAYRDAQLIPSATVTLSKVAPSTTQPTVIAGAGFGGGKREATTQGADQPTQQVALQLDAKAQQAGPTTAPTDKLDVVIVLQSTAPATTEAEKMLPDPATQPAPNAAEHAK